VDVMTETPEQIVTEMKRFILDNWEGFENILRDNNWKEHEDDFNGKEFFIARERPNGNISDFINKLKVMISNDHWYLFYRRLILSSVLFKEGIGYEMFDSNCVSDTLLQSFIAHYTGCNTYHLASMIDKKNKDYINHRDEMYTKFSDAEFGGKLDYFLNFFGFAEAKTIDELELVLKKDGNKKTLKFKSVSIGSLYMTAKRKIEHGDYQDYRKTDYFRAESLKICINHALAEMFLPSLEWADIEEAY